MNQLPHENQTKKYMRTLLFGVIQGPDMQTAARLALEAQPDIDGIELRLDLFADVNQVDLQAFMRRCPLPVMLTVRRQHFALLEALCALAPAYIDLEYDFPLDLRQQLFEAHPHITFLSSYHDFSSTPEDLQALYNRVKTPYAPITKLAVTAKTSNDALRMLLFVQEVSKSQEKIIGICMGEEGRASRILAPIAGNYLTYAPLAHSAESVALGQLTAKELQESYRFRLLTPTTALYALVGDPVDKSLGNLVHNAVFKRLNLNALYIKIAVRAGDLTAFFALALQLPFHGFSVTMPHKEGVVPLLHDSSSQVQKFGSCNTVVVRDRKMTGFNTDAAGALDAIEQRTKVHGKRILFIGAGGSARALVFEAAERGAHVLVVNRTAEKALELAQTVVGGQGGGVELFPEVAAKGYDIIVNCTPSHTPTYEEWILPDTIAMDIVYLPKYTPFLLAAARKNCRLVFGYEMFINQAVEQQRIWLCHRQAPCRCFSGQGLSIATFTT